MISMTGYGQGLQRGPNCQIDCQIKTINGRFLEFRFHLPKEYAGFEAELKRRLAKKIRRGTIDIYVSRQALGKAARKISVDTQLAKQWLSSVRALAKNLKLPADVDISTVISFQGVLHSEESSQILPSEKKLLFSALDLSLAKCMAERAREGLSLRDTLLKFVRELETLVGGMTDLREQINGELRARIEERWRNNKYPGEIDPQRLAQEVVLLIDKADINEEITRLAEHLRTMKDLLKSEDALGKKLDFYSQELLREVNTVGSKSQNARLTALVVDAKGLVERIREQVQNIE